MARGCLSPAAGGLAARRIGGVRRAKRAADERFGEASRLAQFCAVGASGMVVDMITYAGLKAALPAGWAAGRSAAGLAAVALAMTWNFALNRGFTFDDVRGAAPALRQFAAYATGNTAGVALSLALRLGLPSYSAFFRSHDLAAAVLGVIAATGVTFTFSRRMAFRPPARARGALIR